MVLLHEGEHLTRLTGKVALVTGASSGIGKGIACGLAREGAKVVLAARNLDHLQETAQQVKDAGGIALAIQTDVTIETQVIRLFEQALEAFHRLDILVNNAGLVEGGPLDQLSVETWDRVIATNLKGPFLCTREAMR